MNNSDLEMIGVSALTASVLGLKKIKTIAKSEQAYFMLGTECLNSCSFCAQSKDAKVETNFLSRVNWPVYQVDEVINSLSKNKTIKKACFQVVSSYRYFENFIELIKKFKSSVNIPLGVSIDVYSMEQIDILFQEGISNIGIALDAASNEIYKKIKKKNISFNDLLKLIIESAKKYPFKIAVHLIIGLGETDYDVVNLFKILKKKNINLALFAFTPLKGTEMEFYPKVELKRYRNIQFLREVFQKVSEIDIEQILNNIYFDKNNMIEAFSNRILTLPNFLEILKNGNYLKTSGCTLCNRPYYNDEPLNEDLYNFHFDPPIEMIEKWKENFLRNSIDHEK